MPWPELLCPVVNFSNDFKADIPKHMRDVTSSPRVSRTSMVQNLCGTHNYGALFKKQCDLTQRLYRSRVVL